MGTRFARACLWLSCVGALVLFGILVVLVFFHNIAPDAHVSIWIVGFLAIQNLIQMAVIARFLWYQDEYFFVMNAFYPVVKRLQDVQEIRKS